MSYIVSLRLLDVILIMLVGFSTIAVADINIIPQPLSVQAGDGVFLIRSDTSIIASVGAESLADYLVDMVGPATGYDLAIGSPKMDVLAQNSIYLVLDKNSDGGREAYTLKVSTDNVVITASDPAGLFYGLQTLRQLLPVEIESRKAIANVNWAVPVIEIKDSPRFQWRGLHLDVGRHMFPVEFIKKYIDLMAMYKFNTFHWHLTEDQGWRIEIKKYPGLVEIGSKRESSPMLTDRNKPDGIPYSGYYTQEQVKEVVAYAAERYVTVMPEIEMPGHSLGALAAYPELGCTGGPYKVGTRWGVEDEVFCAGNEKTFEFLEGVLDEVLDLFPSKIIHIGGDECPKVYWEKCPKCQKRIKDNNLKDEHGLQSYFITRMEKYLNSKGRKIIGWDEILEGGLAPNAMVMSWRGIQGGIDAAKEGHEVVMSPTSCCYFDYYQSEDHTNEPVAGGGFIPLEKVYSYNPVPEELNTEQSKYVIGVQANVWTEYIPDAGQVEYMAYPRAIALSEVAWSELDNKSYDRFLDSLKTALKRLDILKVNYRDPFQK